MGESERKTLETLASLSRSSATNRYFSACRIQRRAGQSWEATLNALKHGLSEGRIAMVRIGPLKGYRWKA